MEEIYKDIIETETLYPCEFVESFGMQGAHWHNESWKKKELSLRHDMVCILLCNLQPMRIEEIVKSQKRKRKDEGKETPYGPACKKPTVDQENLPGPSTKMDVSFDTTEARSSSSGSHSSGKVYDSRIDAATPFTENKEMFRLWMIEGMPHAPLLQSQLAKEFKCSQPKSQWDIADRAERKFIEVKVTINEGKAIQEFEEKKRSLPHNTALVCVDPRKMTISWHSHPGRLDGEDKVRGFLLKRYQVMRDLGIIDSDLTEEKNAEERVFCSPFLNGLLEEWERDWWCSSENKIPDNLIVRNEPRIPTTIKAHRLLGMLSNLEEKERTDTVKWRGKILPDGFSKDYTSNLDKDIEIVEEFFNMYLLGRYREIVYFGDKEEENRTLKDSFLKDLVKLYLEGEKSNILKLNVSRAAKPHHLSISNALGKGMKKRKFNPNDETTIQPESKKRLLCKYHSWFDEVLRRLCHDKKNLSMIPYKQLLEGGPSERHPIGDTSMYLTTKTLKSLLCSKAALFSQKLTNLHSRLGGSYLHREGHKRIRSDAAIFPIYATCNSMGEIEKREREVSGIVIRGPNHAKSPTDRIPFITIEIVENDKESLGLLYHLPHALIAQNDQGEVIVVRQNSVMKEDLTYGTFNINSSFVPLNLIGTVFFENPDLAKRTDNPFSIIRESSIPKSKWIRERFVEGVVMSAIGNSCDEGYFSILRKLFMIVQNMRNENPSGCWNPGGLCDAANECLVDNPLAMHFHVSLLRILSWYGALENANK